MDINISANTLFHFTSNRQSLKSILTNGFYVRYSLENYESLISGKAEIVFPMVSFCDIPLSQVKRHTSTYGQYAIGLSKKWGMKHKINPVIYTYSKSSTADILNELLAELENFFDINEEGKSILNNLLNAPGIKIKAEFFENKNNSKDSNNSQDWKKIFDLHYKLAHFIKYIKPYEGKFFRNEEYLENPVRFYDEKEWRFVPPKALFNKMDLKDSYNADFYKDPIKRRAINIRLSKHVRLKFLPSDIRFIIVNKESEIPGMLEDIHEIFGGNTSFNDVKLLGTRLISLEQILDDL